MVEVILADMCQAFEPLSAVNFVLDRLETIRVSPRSRARECRDSRQAPHRYGRSRRPYRAHAPLCDARAIRKLLLQQFMGKNSAATRLESHLATELWQRGSRSTPFWMSSGCL